MGGAVSSGENNDELVDNLLEADYIKSPVVEKILRAVDRAFYYTKASRQNPYKDLAWKDGNLHMSAPCIYSEVLENLNLKAGLSFLNIGSGTGYLSSMVGLLLGRGGINHGIELHADVVEYARCKLERFKRTSYSLDLFDFCEPVFVVGNCMDALPVPHRYDRIYCGAGCPSDFLQTIVDSLKIGGILVVPINDSLVQMKRITETEVEKKILLSVSFASLVETSRKSTNHVQLPEWNAPTLKEMCRAVMREAIRTNCSETISELEEKKANERVGKAKLRKQNRRTHQHRTCVIGRLNGEGRNHERGILSIAYALRNESQDSDDDSLYHPHEEEDSSMNQGSDTDDERAPRPFRSRSKSASSSSSTESKASSENSKNTTASVAADFSTCSSDLPESSSDKTKVQTNSNSTGQAEATSCLDLSFHPVPRTDNEKEQNGNGNAVSNPNDRVANDNSSDSKEDETNAEMEVIDETKPCNLNQSPSPPLLRPIPISSAHASRLHFLRQVENMEVEEGHGPGQVAEALSKFSEEVSRRLVGIESNRKTQTDGLNTCHSDRQHVEEKEEEEEEEELAQINMNSNQYMTPVNKSADVENMQGIADDLDDDEMEPSQSSNPNDASAIDESTSEGRVPPAPQDLSVEMGENDKVREDLDHDDHRNPRRHPGALRYPRGHVAVDRVVYLNVPVNMSDEDYHDSGSEDGADADGDDGYRKRPQQQQPQQQPQRHVAVVQLHDDRQDTPSPTPTIDFATEFQEEPSTEVTHPVSIQMRDKINQLPLPPALKLYLRYNRP